jgi:hypothetical protein
MIQLVVGCPATQRDFFETYRRHALTPWLLPGVRQGEEQRTRASKERATVHLHSAK